MEFIVYIIRLFPSFLSWVVLSKLKILKEKYLIIFYTYEEGAWNVFDVLLWL